MSLMHLVSAPDGPPRVITRRSRGITQGSITRLVRPMELGHLLKPFVSLNYFDHDGPPYMANLGPHSGIATHTYVIEGRLSYIDHGDRAGSVLAGGLEWRQAGRGMWHGGGVIGSGRTRGFHLWIALPPESELGPTIATCLSAGSVPSAGSAKVLLGSYGGASSLLMAPSPINYLSIRLQAGERWTYHPPPSHSVLWVAIASGFVFCPGVLRQGEVVAFEPSENPVTFEANGEVEFVLGSAVPHNHDLVVGRYSVHTSEASLRAGEAHLLAIRKRLIHEDRL